MIEKILNKILLLISEHEELTSFMTGSVGGILYVGVESYLLGKALTMFFAFVTAVVCGFGGVLGKEAFTKFVHKYNERKKKWKK